MTIDPCTVLVVSPMVKEWESGRRPSLFTALAKLRGGMLKNRARAGSTDSTHSNISTMSEKETKEINFAGLRVRSVNKSGDESEGPITPLETYNDGVFPDTSHLKTEDGNGN